MWTPERRAKLAAADKLWAWKYGLRVLTLIMGIIGMGCLAYATTAAQSDEYYAGSVMAPFCLIPICISIVFNLVFLLYTTFASRPPHPGIAVGFDLILWLALIVSSLFAVGLALDTLYYYNDYNNEDDYGYSYSTGHYVTYANGSSYWVYDDPTSSTTQTSNDDSAAKSAAANTLGRCEMTAAAVGFLAVLLHFTLFVWACVDTDRRNKAAKSACATAVAEGIVRGMVERGELVPSVRQPVLAHVAPAHWAAQYQPLAEPPAAAGDGQTVMMPPPMPGPIRGRWVPDPVQADYYAPPSVAAGKGKAPVGADVDPAAAGPSSQPPQSLRPGQKPEAAPVLPEIQVSSSERAKGPQRDDEITSAAK